MTMPRYIDTEDFKHLINASSLYDTEEWVKIMDLLADTPTADVRGNVHGMWIFKNDNIAIPTGYYECSICGEGKLMNKHNFCQNCGAVMDKREEE